MNIKTIPGYMYYSATDDGRIYSHLTHKYIRPGGDKDGYLQVWVKNNYEIRQMRKVHRLVALAWIPNDRPEANCIDHINGDISDNRVCNLRWCTVYENATFPLARKHHCEAQKKLCENPEWVESLRKRGRVGLYSLKRPYRRAAATLTACVTYTGGK